MAQIPQKIPSILSEKQYQSCMLCPRQCGADRTSSRTGYCRCTDRILAARAALHPWEEPCISGQNGSGAVFFSGCTLGCSFCQNYSVSRERFGRAISVRRLADIFLRLQDEGAHNINLVTATQYLPSVVKALELVRDRLLIPVVFNCGGYERPEIVRALEGYVDIWLPDLKYYDPALAARCSQAGAQMIAQTGAPVMDENGLLRSGVVVRHLVLPGARTDSIRLLHWMKENLPEGKWLLSLMSQYTPAGEAAAASSEAKAGSGRPCPDLSRRVTTFEYESVLNTAVDLGLTAGYMQQKSSAKEEYTPPFDLTGI